MKSTLTRSNVLDVNKFKVVENWVLFYHWYDKDVKESINKTLNHYNDMEGITLDINMVEVKSRLKEYVYKCINDINYLTNELNQERKKYISPTFKSLKDYFAYNEISIKTVKDYQDFLRNYVITELN